MQESTPHRGAGWRVEFAFSVILPRRFPASTEYTRALVSPRVYRRLLTAGWQGGPVLNRVQPVRPAFTSRKRTGRAQRTLQRHGAEFGTHTAGRKAATQGRAIDHLGWGLPDLDAAAAIIKSKGVDFAMEPRPFTNPLGQEMKISFVIGPDDVRIEIVQPGT